jgi:hypothetical protein
MREISWLAEELLAAQGGLCSMKLVSQLAETLVRALQIRGKAYPYVGPIKFTF